MRQSLVESSTLAVAGGLLGLALSAAGLQFFIHAGRRLSSWPSLRSARRRPVFRALRVDPISALRAE